MQCYRWRAITVCPIKFILVRYEIISLHCHVSIFCWFERVKGTLHFSRYKTKTKKRACVEKGEMCEVKSIHTENLLKTIETEFVSP